MRTETFTVTRNLYHFNELSDEAKDHFIYNSYAPDEFDRIVDDCRPALDEFCKIFGVKMRDWNFDGYSYWFNAEVENEDVENLSGIRLAKYVWNNCARYLEENKFYWNGIHSSRKSKIIVTLKDAFPFTGEWIDYDMMKPIYECLHYKRMFTSMKELVNEVIENYFNAMKQEYDGVLEYDSVNEVAESNEWEFTEDGDIA